MVYFSFIDMCPYLSLKLFYVGLFENSKRVCDNGYYPGVNGFNNIFDIIKAILVF